MSGSVNLLYGCLVYSGGNTQVCGLHRLIVTALPWAFYHTFYYHVGHRQAGLFSLHLSISREQLQLMACADVKTAGSKGHIALRVSMSTTQMKGRLGNSTL